MENDMEREYELLKQLKNDKENLTENEELKDLAMLQTVLRQNRFFENTNKILAQNKWKKTRWQQYLLPMAALLIMILSFGGYLLISKTFLKDIIVEKDILRGEKENLTKPILPEEKAYFYFLEGKANYYAGDYQKAIKLYNEALKAPNLRNQIREAINWHLCIAYYMNKDFKNCRNTLASIESIEVPKYAINKLDLLKLKTQLWFKESFQ